MSARRRWWCRLRDDETGAVAIYFAVGAPMLVGLTALSVDVGLVNLMENRLQITADAAALAGAGMLPDETAAGTRAQEIARANIPDEGGTTVVAASDVEIGHFEDDVFTAGAADPNAVRVTARRAAANGNPFDLLAGRLLAFGPLDLEGVAIAERRRHRCITDGFVAQGRIVMNSNNQFAGLCLHGQGGATMNSNNRFSPDSGLSMPDLDDLIENNNNVGLYDVLSEEQLTPTNALSVGDIIADFEAGTGPWPDYLDGTIVAVTELPAAPVAGTLYVVDGNVRLKGDYSDFGVVAKGDIEVRSNSVIENILLVAAGAFESSSNVDIGGANYCTSGDGSVLIAAAGDVSVASNTGFRGTQMIAGGDVDMGSNQDNIAGLVVQAGGDITLGSNARSNCNEKAHVLFNGGNDAWRLRLVR